MRFLFFCLAIAICLPLSVVAKPLHYYFPEDIQFNPNIPKPSEVLGYEVGQWHVRHDQLVQYMKVLAKTSDRVQIKTIGYTHEKRPLLLLTITAPNKLQRIEKIRTQHLARLFSEETSVGTPAVAWMGYSVHGNEPSGSNAALLVAYYLAAAQNDVVTELLNNTVILLDPSLNPDGLARFAQWANSNRGMNLSADPQHREHVEAWPSGRTNHYMFDLNRDWLLLQHPESQARVSEFHRWKPNVLTDFHEMGSNSSYFFQPGIASRTHPLTPKMNVTLTEVLAQFHAKSLDDDKQLYFTQESFDDFYYGKGSTYPDANGAIGILFEQASSRGHVQDTINGQLSFAQTIKNQVTTSLSTFTGIMANKKQLLSYQQQFYQQAVALADKEKFAGYVVSAGQDQQKFETFLSLLSQHQIEGFTLQKPFKVAGYQYQIGDIYVPLAQPQYRLVKAVFSEQKTFQDNTFYDVSGWTLAHAFNLNFAKADSTWGLKVSEQPWKLPAKQQYEVLPDAYAYSFSWQQWQAPKMLNFLLKNKIEARVAMKAFNAITTSGEHAFASGSIVIPSGLQQNKRWLALLNMAQTKFSVKIHPITTGLTSKGIDLGSRNMSALTRPKVLLVGGEGTSQYEVGEVWYHLDKHLGIAPTLVEQDRIAQVNLSKYSHIILTDGRLNRLSDRAKVLITGWVNKGGVIWGHKRGAKWLLDSQMLNAKSVSKKEMAEQFNTKELTYGDQDSLGGKQRIAGAIFSTELDLSHPLSFGFERATLPVFKNSTWLLKAPEKPFLSVSKYVEKPLLSGYAAAENVSKISEGAAVIAHRYGKGSVIASTDNPVFRGYWYGSSRLLTNAIFFGHTLSVQGR
ncbi:M14 metallopeptidase family protein [Pseudoalteromonas sp. MMG012]|uniref:M14 metallopeptidase family protein n=1 Tax=Pseudoalteromonas sp. MMG012 TaxID=2822686 RepID=UPI001B3A2A08|nr:M14 metallopeptidase family protein [Pseudoalteromonas sp. MMG012]MBQ4850472.1 peptidase M14 [Pseudoalteromonas sp. MMG012]